MEKRVYGFFSMYHLPTPNIFAWLA